MEYLAEIIIAVSAAATFIAHYIYLLGKLHAEVKNLEHNVKWVRDYLLCDKASDKDFKQESTLDFAIRKSDRLISGVWETMLDLQDRRAYFKCETPTDCVVVFSNSFGLVAAKKMASTFNTDLSTFLLASGLYLYQKIKL
jgi:hypothetical protein